MRHLATWVTILVLLAAIGVTARWLHPSPGVLGTYRGTFVWDGAEHPEPVTLNLNQSRPETDGKLELSGTGRYEEPPGCDIDVRVVFEPSSRSVQMWEMNPRGSDAARFVTAGFHVGVLTPDGHLDATWKGEQGGPQGRLVMDRQNR
jgi:hypothetical protein